MIEALWASQKNKYQALVVLPDDVSKTHTQFVNRELKLKSLRCALGKVNDGSSPDEEHPSKRHCSKRLNDASQWEADSDASVKSASSAGSVSPSLISVLRLGGWARCGPIALMSVCAIGC